MAKNTMYEAPTFGDMQGVVVEHKTPTGAVAKLEFVPDQAVDEVDEVQLSPIQARIAELNRLIRNGGKVSPGDSGV